jgi:hypothetical protein
MFYKNDEQKTVKEQKKLSVHQPPHEHGFDIQLHR